MHRSSSYYLSTTTSPSPASSAEAAGGPGGTAGMDVDSLPTYDPQSDAGKKEALDASRANFAHTLVHLVPVVVLLCGLLLWSFSTTAPSSDVGVMVNKHAEAKLLPLTNSRSMYNLNGSGMKTGMEDPDPTGKHGVGKKSLKRRNLKSEM